MRALAIGAAIGLMACGPSLGEGNESGSGRADSTSSGAGMTDVTGTSGTGTGTGTRTGTESSSSSDGSSSDGSSSESTGEIPSVCFPQPEATNAAVLLDAGVERPDSIVVDDDCTIASTDALDELTQRYVLSCGDLEHTLDVLASPPVASTMRVGEAVHLRARLETYFDSPSQEYIAVYDLAGTLVLGMFGSLSPPADLDVTTWFAPFELAFDDGVCEAEPFEPPPMESGGFIVDECPDRIERAAFMVRSPWAMGFVYDATSSPFGDYEVYVPWARTLTAQGDPELCNESPQPIGRVVFLPGRSQ